MTRESEQPFQCLFGITSQYFAGLVSIQLTAACPMSNIVDLHLFDRIPYISCCILLFREREDILFLMLKIG